MWLRRGANLAFGGFYAFAGGKLDDSDRATPMSGPVDHLAVLRATAARELFEETGVLVAAGADRLGPDVRRTARQALIDGSTTFAALCQREGLTVEAERFVEAGRWITPEFYPTRFDTQFFLVELPDGQAVSLEESGESQEGGFVSAEEALARWRTGRALLHPPAWNAFVALALPQIQSTLERLRSPPLVQDHVAQRIEFQEGIVLVPQRTPTLPPATHTSCFLIGRGAVLIVDPGAVDEAELGRLFPVIDALAAEGRTPIAIALTHHHHDHVAGVPAVARRYGLPIWAHPLAGERLVSQGIAVGRVLADDETLLLGDFRLTALHTPGHTRDHLCFLDPASGALLAGDLISSVSTIVIDPPEGDMASYLASLRRLLALKVRALYPAHGPVLADGGAKLQDYLDHRLERERQVLQALADGFGTPAEIVPRVYVGTPEFLFPLAERSVQAHLDKLEAEGRAIVRGNGYVVGSLGSRV